MCLSLWLTVLILSKAKDMQQMVKLEEEMDRRPATLVWMTETHTHTHTSSCRNNTDCPITLYYDPHLFFTSTDKHTGQPHHHHHHPATAHTPPTRFTPPAVTFAYDWKSFSGRIHIPVCRLCFSPSLAMFCSYSGTQITQVVCFFHDYPATGYRDEGLKWNVFKRFYVDAAEMILLWGLLYVSAVLSQAPKRWSLQVRNVAVHYCRFSLSVRMYLKNCKSDKCGSPTSTMQSWGDVLLFQSSVNRFSESGNYKGITVDSCSLGILFSYFPAVFFKQMRS